MAIQAIRNAQGNSTCVDCGAPSEHQGTSEGPGWELGVCPGFSAERLGCSSPRLSLCGEPTSHVLSPPDPTWASLNLGALICIECSGIHRNLGTHLSRVRSLDLDDWPRELTLVLTAIGNDMANRVWESDTRGRAKPTRDSSRCAIPGFAGLREERGSFGFCKGGCKWVHPSSGPPPTHPRSCREERESWIRAKYEQLLFLAPLGTAAEEPLGLQLWAAVQAQDVAAVLLLLAHARHGPLDTSLEDPQLRSPLHLAAELAHVVITQLLLWVRGCREAKGGAAGHGWGASYLHPRTAEGGSGLPGSLTRSFPHPRIPRTAPMCPPATRKDAQRSSTPARQAASSAWTSCSSTAAPERVAAVPPPP